MERYLRIHTSTTTNRSKIPRSTIGDRTTTTGSKSEAEQQIIEAIGVTGVVGYEAEVNQCIGVSSLARHDYHLLLAVSHSKTFTYSTWKKHRIFFAAASGEPTWFRTLFEHANKEIIALRTDMDETLYHLLCNNSLDVENELLFERYLHRFSRQPEQQVFPPGIDLGMLMEAFSEDGDSQTDSNSPRSSRSNESSDDSGSISIPPLRNIEGRLEIFRILAPTSLRMDILDSRGLTPLHLAVQRNSLELVTEFLKYSNERGKFNINKSDKLGNSALHLAVYLPTTSIPILRVLLHSPMDINLLDNSDIPIPPFFLAVQEGKMNVIAEFLKLPAQKFNLNFQEPASGKSALFSASGSGKWWLVEQLCNAGINLNLTDDTGSNALFAAVSGGYFRTVRKLLTYIDRFDINATNEKDENLLHVGTMNKRYDIVKLLCGTPINMDQKDSLGRIPLSSAVVAGNYQIVRELLKYRDRYDIDSVDNEEENALHLSCAGNNVDIVRLLLNSTDIDMNARNEMGFTPLMSVAITGNESILQELLRHRDRLEVNAQDTGGHTPIWVTSRFNFVACLRLLADAGGDINIENDDDISPLYTAMVNGHIAIVETLISYGTSLRINNVNGNNESVIHSACRGGSLAMVKLLVRVPHVDLRIQNFCCGHNPLHIAVIRGEVSFVEELLRYQNKFDINTQDNRNGDTAMHRAVSGNHVPIVQVLLQQGKGLRLYIRNTTDKLTPLGVARKNRNEDIIRLLLPFTSL